MFHELDVPRCEESYPDYLGKWFVVNSTYDAFLTYTLHSGLAVETLDKDNLEKYFWDDEVDALRAMQQYYDGWNISFPYDDILAALDSNAPTAVDTIESEVMRFE